MRGLLSMSIVNNGKRNDCVIEPVCEVVLPTSLICRMTYEWQGRAVGYNSPPKVDVSLSWTDGSGTSARTTADPSTYSGTVETSRTIQNTMESTISSHHCKITFDFSPGDGTRFQQYAVNQLSYTYTCQQNPDWRKCDFTYQIAIMYTLLFRSICQLF